MSSGTVVKVMLDQELYNSGPRRYDRSGSMLSKKGLEEPGEW
jgi:hypothetical protein